MKNMDTVASKRVCVRVPRGAELSGSPGRPRLARPGAPLARLSLPWRTIYNNEASAVPGSHAVTLSPKPLSLSILSVLTSAALLLSRTAPFASELKFSLRDLPALGVVSVTGRWDE